MLDFLIVSDRQVNKGTAIEIYPKFAVYGQCSDLMIRGGDFYAIWNEDTKLWCTDEEAALRLIDRDIRIKADEYKAKHPDTRVNVLYMWDSDSGSIDRWHKFVQKQLRDKYHPLDEKLIFSNVETTKTDYASKKLKYPFERCETPAYNELMETLYSPSERAKIEWAIGAVVSGESKYIQKFIVMYGAAGTGKSTVLNIIQDLFDGYYSVFESKALGQANNAFALEAFRSNPLVAIEHDGDLSRIEDNTRLNSLVSHEQMTVNEKFKSTYTNRFNSFLFMGTNRPVKITDAKSGLLRRLIDVSPTGNKLPVDKYKELTSKIKFELGGIAAHCLDVYNEDPGAYDTYIPVTMLGASNDFYNFVEDSYEVFRREDGVTLKQAWTMYTAYCEEAKVPYPFSQRLFREELKNYFKEFKERAIIEDGVRVRNYYCGFIFEKFEYEPTVKPQKKEPGLVLDSYTSIFDKEFENAPAQYANANETPLKKWSDVKTILSDIDTSKLHYVKVPESHIVIDFDMKDEDGKKSFELNAKAASRWPPTYAELSKGGQGIHLHYNYSGDPSKLSRVYDDEIEVKVFTGNSSLRRKLTKCNNLPIATINSGLPLKKEEKMVNFEGLKNVRGLRTVIKRNLNKEYHPGTKPSVDFIYKVLEDAYNSGMKYDVTDMRQAILAFAAQSTNHSDYCIKMVNKMKFKSEEPSENSDVDEKTLVFYDVEVFSNLFVVVYKPKGKPKVSLINPSASEIENLVKFNLVGFNCRRYDNHILYGRLMGYTNKQLYQLSQRIINNSVNAFFSEAYNISYTDIYDFASAGNKKSLKKLEIEMGIHHQELPLRWDEPVPEDKWPLVAEYCGNDVDATEAAFDYLQGDWIARQILADIADMTVNDTTNSLTQKIIFGSNRKPQNEFCYRDLGKPVKELDPEVESFLKEACPEMMAKPFLGGSKLPWFEGYKFENGKSTYMDINPLNIDPKRREVGEGGCVYAVPGIWGNVALLDIASQHPHSVIAECLFGPRFTRRFRDIVEGRVDIKHEDWAEVDKLFDGKLHKYIEKVQAGEITSKQLANGLKTAINAVYGLTAAGFENPFRDLRNVDNIVAKRGALFMITLRHEVWKRGYKVAHIKTDSIKIPDATPEIIQFVMDFGKRYGYTFEHEATYEKMCLVNDAVYIAQYKDAEDCKNIYGYVPDENRKHSKQWTATGAQFQQPYVFKKLFSREPIAFNDMCQTFAVTSALYLDMNENLGDEEHNYHFIGKVGQFCPVKRGRNGGELVREGLDKNNNIKYSSATGAKGYRWLETEMIKNLGKEDCVDESYYTALTDAAIEAIKKYGDVEWFISEDPYVPEIRKEVS